MGSRSGGEHGSVRVALLWSAAVLVLGSLLAVVAGLSFSVNVVGSSMEPTLSEGDRLEVNPFDNAHIARFDIVEALPPNGGAPVVKRIIALPGDQVKVTGGEDTPEVLVRPARTETVYRVDNGTWEATYDHAAQLCCDDQGRASGTAGWATVPDDSYWVVGDNWSGSTDSRTFGWIRESDIQAKIWLRIMPAQAFGKLPMSARLVLQP
ncbi:MAG: signal peptidase I [Nocardioidaceae bacterium]